MRRETVWMLALLATIGALIYWPTVHLRPLSGDNIYILAWSDATHVSGLWATDPRLYPEWRPLAFLSLWLEHRQVPLAFVAVHHVVNFLIWTACALLVAAIVRTLTASTIAGAAAAVFLLTDMRAVYTQVWIIERQTSLACAFGLAAMLVILRAGSGPLGRTRVLVTGVLLLASSLSKEYGLAFTAATLTYGAWRRRGDLALAGGGAALAYAALRLSVGGALGPYCEDMAYFNDFRYTCLSPTSVETLFQVAYNAAAAGVGMAFQGLLSEEGLLSPDVLRVATAAVLLVPAVWAVVAGPRFIVMAGLVTVYAAALNFMLYRDRNHLVGACGLAIATGVGIALGDRRFRDRPSLRYAVWGILGVLLAIQAARTHRVVLREVDNLLVGRDPCNSQIMTRRFGPAFVAKVKQAYGMDDPTCTAD